MVNKGKILGIDFGDRRVGIAISDPDQQIAFPRDFLEYESRKSLIAEIAQICADERVVGIVVGMPIQMTGKMGDRAEKTYDFRDQLTAAMPNMPIAYFDERLSSQYASKALQSQGIKAKDQKGKRDALAAQIILHNYLNSI